MERRGKKQKKGTGDNFADGKLAIESAALIGPAIFQGKAESSSLFFHDYSLNEALRFFGGGKGLLTLKEIIRQPRIPS